MCTVISFLWNEDFEKDTWSVHSYCWKERPDSYWWEMSCFIDAMKPLTLSEVWLITPMRKPWLTICHTGTDWLTMHVWQWHTGTDWLTMQVWQWHTGTDWLKRQDMQWHTVVIRSNFILCAPFPRFNMHKACCKWTCVALEAWSKCKISQMCIDVLLENSHLNRTK